mmetsp:Transcript_3912/g.12214  ORF Transcript_3912/g.12214 Transcript_3912/m.12214 type:complete len:357 (-) Transcript_3912:223-1293(-)
MRTSSLCGVHPNVTEEQAEAERRLSEPGSAMTPCIGARDSRGDGSTDGGRESWLASLPHEISRATSTASTASSTASFAASSAPPTADVEEEGSTRASIASTLASPLPPRLPLGSYWLRRKREEPVECGDDSIGSRRCESRRDEKRGERLSSAADTPSATPAELVDAAEHPSPQPPPLPLLSPPPPPPAPCVAPLLLLLLPPLLTALSSSCAISFGDLRGRLLTAVPLCDAAPDPTLGCGLLSPVFERGTERGRSTNSRTTGRAKAAAPLSRRPTAGMGRGLEEENCRSRERKRARRVDRHGLGHVDVRRRHLLLEPLVLPQRAGRGARLWVAVEAAEQKVVEQRGAGADLRASSTG